MEDSIPEPGTTLRRTARLEARSLRARQALGGDQTHSHMLFLAFLIVSSALQQALVGSTPSLGSIHASWRHHRRVWSLRKTKLHGSWQLPTQSSGGAREI